MIKLPNKLNESLDLLKKWYPEDDPITKEQVIVLNDLLDDLLTEKALEGFLIVCSRFVDEFGSHRTEELARIFRTHCAEGKQALVDSLEHMRNWVGGMNSYEQLYPVTIIPPKPAFPQFKIVGIENISSNVYRALDSKGTVYPTNELLRDYIFRTGRLPAVPRQRHPVRRSKPRFHWCSYSKWENPEETRNGLQIIPDWSDCKIRATIRTSKIRKSAYVAFNGDKEDPTDKKLRFYKYYYEPIAQDHPPLTGGGAQIALEGEPSVDKLEFWEEAMQNWRVVWTASSK